jgi:nicotinate-nucleotide adenylyltransferase
LRLLLFGGSFDPVHNGHVAMWRAAVAALQPDERRILPVGNAWQKGRLPLADTAHRVAMLRLAFPDAHIDQRELHRAGPTYTVDTLTELAEEFPQHARFWLLGSDSAARLQTWHRADELARLATFVSVRRADEPATHRDARFGLRDIDCMPPAVSSTAVRAACAQQQPIRGMVPDSVCDYIEQHQLYR